MRGNIDKKLEFIYVIIRVYSMLDWQTLIPTLLRLFTLHFYYFIIVHIVLQQSIKPQLKMIIDVERFMVSH